MKEKIELTTDLSEITAEQISEYEGLQSEIRDLETPIIEVFENQYGKYDEVYTVNLRCGKGELTSICPKTGLPDFATLYVEYQPAAHCIELKSFKEYLLFYRNIGIFHENLTNKITDDLWNSVKPRYLHVKIEMNPRGNIETIVERTRGEKE